MSVFTGFPHADIEQAGLSVVVVTDGDLRQAEIWRDELLDQAWNDREAFVYRPEPLADSVARAKALGAEPGDGPVILLDHYDNTASGGTMDTTDVLAEILRQGLEDVAVFGIFDPAAVARDGARRCRQSGNGFARGQTRDAVDQAAEPAADRDRAASS